ncbi:hypothetical protein [Nocardia fusca]|uniref:hypothetical protein n=1 Tax=Nocardia fusca TaxID=941183 RepID=UPI0007A75812|nr:hypothetical protein [Nocardia fusca]
MRAFFPDHKPHPGRPTRQIQQSYSAVCDAVQKTTVRELTEAMYKLRDKDGNRPYTPNMAVEAVFGRGPW